MHLRQTWAVIGAVALLTASCDQLIKPVTVNEQDEAASVEVSVSSVVPWSQVSAALAPGFTLTGDQAVSKVLPTTAIITSQILNAFGLNLGVGLPSTTSTYQGTTTSNASGQTTSSTTTNNAGPGSAPTPPTGVPAGVTGLPTAPPPGGSIGLDPVLQYQAARDLFQAVTLMNQEVQNAAAFSCYVPFLVRLKLGVMLYRPNPSYAVHARVSFFEHTSVPSATAPDNPVALLRAQQSTVQSNANAYGETCSNTGIVPKIVPILATDDIERTLESRAVESATQIGFAVSAMVHGVGILGNLNNVRQTINAINGQNYNSRLSIVRQAENVLYVRIGATQQASSGQALVGQSYDIATILLVPRSYLPANDPKLPDIDVVTYTKMLDANTGAPLPGRSDAAYLKQVDAVMDDVLRQQQYASEAAAWAKLDAPTKRTIGEWMQHTIQTNSYVNFKEALQPDKTKGCVVPEKPTAPQFLATLPCGLAPSLWTRASTLIADDSFKSAILQLKRPSGIQIPGQAAVLDDSGKTTAQVVLQRVSGDSAGSLLATVTFTPKSRAAIAVPGQATLDPNLHTLTIVFPSFAKFGVSKQEDLGTSPSLTITQPTCQDGQHGELCPALTVSGPLPVLLGTVPAAAPAAAVAPLPSLSYGFNPTGTGKISPDASGKATVILALGTVTDDVLMLNVDGATVETGTITPGGALSTATAAGIPIAKGAGGTITLSLNKVPATGVVKITAQGGKTDASSKFTASAATTIQLVIGP